MKTVLVIMTTYNGEKYLPEQLDSLLHQEGVNVSILVRDDGSKDGTRAVLDQYQSEGKLTWYVRGNWTGAVAENWGSAVITGPVSVTEMHVWLKENPDAFIAAIR